MIWNWLFSSSRAFLGKVFVLKIQVLVSGGFSYCQIIFGHKRKRFVSSDKFSRLLWELVRKKSFKYLMFLKLYVFQIFLIKFKDYSKSFIT